MNTVYDLVLVRVDYRQLPLVAGQRVALALDNRPEFFSHWLALNALGISVVPLNSQWRSGELEYVFSHSEARLVVCLPEKVQLLQKVAKSLKDVFTVLSVADWNFESETFDISEQANCESECARRIYQERSAPTSG